LENENSKVILDGNIVDVEVYYHAKNFENIYEKISRLEKFQLPEHFRIDCDLTIIYKQELEIQYPEYFI